MNFLQHFIFTVTGILLSLLNGNFAEFLHVLHDGEGGLAGAGTSGLVTLHYLCFGVLGEFSEFSIDFFNKLFHNGFLFI